MKSSLRSSLWILLMMGLTAFALLHFVDVKLEDQPGIRMTLPDKAAGRVGRGLRYCHAAECRQQFFSDELGRDPELCPSCGAPLFNMSFEEWEQLPRDTTFIKSKFGENGHDPVFVSVVLSGRDRESIHRPERCLVGQGLTITRRVTVPVNLPDGRSIQIMAIEFQRTFGAGEEKRTVHGYFGYWFVGVGRETHSHWSRIFWLAWDRVIHSVAHRWAYISISGNRDPNSLAYQEELRNFVTDLHGHLVL